MLRYLPVLLSLIIWSWSGILIKHLQENAAFDAYTQNFYRYAASAIIMLLVALVVDRGGLKRAFSSRSFALTGVLGACYQTLWVLGFYYVYPTFASLVGRSNMIFTVLIGVAFFPDERRLAGNPRFLAALAVALLGVSGVILFHPGMKETGRQAGQVIEATEEGRPAQLEQADEQGPEVDRQSLLLGSFLIILGSGMWVAYVYGAKVMMKASSPTASFAAANVVMAVVLCVVALIAQGAGSADLGRVLAVRWYDVLILFGSGILCVGIAQAVYYLSVKRVGVALSQTVALISPLLIGLNSFLIFRERLTLLQWISGVVLLLALGYVLHLENRLRRREGIQGA